MAGAIIENMSTKKLCIVGGILLVFQIVAFLVGGLIAPAPTTAVSYVAAKCVDVRKNHHKTRWLMPWGPNKCNKINDFEEAIPREIEANDIVFSVHIPLPSMEMSPWFQFMLFYPADRHCFQAKQPNQRKCRSFHGCFPGLP